MQTFKMSPLCLEREGRAVLILYYFILASRNGCERTQIGYFNYSDGLGDKAQSWYRQRCVKQYLYMTAVLLVWTVHFCLGTHSVVLFNLHVLMKQFVIK